MTTSWNPDDRLKEQIARRLMSDCDNCTKHRELLLVHLAKLTEKDAEIERLNEKCDALTVRLNAVYTQWPVELTDEQIYDAYETASKNHRKHQSSIRGQQLVSADSFEWHFARAVLEAAKGKS